MDMTVCAHGSTVPTLIKAPRLIASAGSIPLLGRVGLGGVSRQVVVSEVLSITSRYSQAAYDTISTTFDGP